MTKILSKIKEDEGNVIEACDILQELQVETFGSMERPEKTDFFLEQMRLRKMHGKLVASPIRDGSTHLGVAPRPVGLLVDPLGVRCQALIEYGHARPRLEATLVVEADSQRVELARIGKSEEGD